MPTASNSYLEDLLLAQPRQRVLVLLPEWSASYVRIGTSAMAIERAELLDLRHAFLAKSEPKRDCGMIFRNRLGE